MVNNYFIFYSVIHKQYNFSLNFISSGIKVLTIFFVCTSNDELKIPSSIAKLDINSEFDFLRNSVFIQSFNFFLDAIAIASALILASSYALDKIFFVLLFYL